MLSKLPHMRKLHFKILFTVSTQFDYGAKSRQAASRNAQRRQLLPLLLNAQRKE